MSERCNEYREKIAAILAGDVTAVDANAAERHLLVCPDCLRFHQDLLKDDQLLTEFVRSADDEVTRLEGLVMDTIDSMDMSVPRAKESAWWWERIFQPSQNSLPD